MPSIFKGYVIAPSNTAPDKFEIVFAGTHGQRVAATTGVARPDVARHFNAPALARSGFRIGVDFSAMPAGSYDIEFHGIDAGQGWFCASRKTNVVAPCGSGPRRCCSWPSSASTSGSHHSTE